MVADNRLELPLLPAHQNPIESKISIFFENNAYFSYRAFGLLVGGVQFRSYESPNSTFTISGSSVAKWRIPRFRRFSNVPGIRKSTGFLQSDWPIDGSAVTIARFALVNPCIRLLEFRENQST